MGVVFFFFVLFFLTWAAAPGTLSWIFMAMRFSGSVGRSSSARLLSRVESSIAECEGRISFLSDASAFLYFFEAKRVNLRGSSLHPVLIVPILIFIYLCCELCSCASTSWCTFLFFSRKIWARACSPSSFPVLGSSPTEQVKGTLR